VRSWKKETKGGISGKTRWYQGSSVARCLDLDTKIAKSKKAKCSEVKGKKRAGGEGRGKKTINGKKVAGRSTGA